ncbi:helix-turn-helix transcriptional regulator [Sedimentitalea todarodis]|uniref:DNA-binding protein n=1 Tax=Sedimentitalea todarodis TaxID=1631240 RepID=A0ABU3VJN8_9RHOB|nr:helix-turn-helix domain-containing protein [Sedimentitalea todarodis]MDU9006369.1 DNA-binding protein [Sedimentitalea todarodis]
MSEVCVNQKELAARWKISHRTLERWRWVQEGPRYLRIGGRVVYRLSDVEAFERKVQSVPDELLAEG